MLIGFSVSNFKSFESVQSISFMSSKIARHKKHVTVAANKKILKSALVFGANAGGKSNLIGAVDFSKKIVVSGLDKLDLEKKYFRINREAYKIPGVFEYRLIANEVEYSYGIAISYDNKEIVGEWLVKIALDGSEEIIFNREIDESGESIVSSDKIYDSNEEKNRMDIYLEDFGINISDSLKKKTILSDIAERVNGKQGIFKEIISVYEWFKNIIIIHPYSKYAGLNSIASDDDMRSLFAEWMLYFDTGINAIEGTKETLDFDKVIQNLSNEDAEKLKTDISNATDKHPILLKSNKQVYILKKSENGEIVYDKMQLNHGNSEDLFDYFDESDGTKRLFDLVPLFFMSKRKSVILIDEIDRSLHTNLTKKFMELFYEVTEENPCQLIATTHDSNLLDLDLIRQDEIWFVERQENHSSQIYSLSKYKERFDKKIDKEYLLGRYGAIPVFDDNILEEEFADEK